MTAPMPLEADIRGWLRQLTDTHLKSTPGSWEQDGEFPAEVYNGAWGDAERLVADCSMQGSAADAAAIVSTHNALMPLVAALTAVLDLADEAERKGERSPFRDFGGNSWPAPITPDAIRAAVAAAGVTA